MTQIDAVYRGGVFEPLEPVSLPDDQHVRLSIHPCSSQDWQNWLQRTEEHKADIVRRFGVLPDSAPDIAADRLR